MKKIYIITVCLPCLSFQPLHAETWIGHLRKEMIKEERFVTQILRKEDPPIQRDSQDPITTYCGADCMDCGYSQHTCMKVLQDYFSTLCQNQPAPSQEEFLQKTFSSKDLQTIHPNQNCFLIWQRYARTCEQLCGDR